MPRRAEGLYACSDRLVTTPALALSSHATHASRTVIVAGTLSRPSFCSTVCSSRQRLACLSAAALARSRLPVAEAGKLRRTLRRSSREHAHSSQVTRQSHESPERLEHFF